MVPAITLVIAVQVKGSIIATHLHIDGQSDIGSGPNSTQGTY
jgi:hypothetical protein